MCAQVHLAACACTYADALEIEPVAPQSGLSLAYNSGCKVDLKSTISLMHELMFRAGVNSFLVIYIIIYIYLQ